MYVKIRRKEGVNLCRDHVAIKYKVYEIWKAKLRKYLILVIVGNHFVVLRVLSGGWELSKGEKWGRRSHFQF